MPWKASRPVDLKAEFITRLKRGERMTDLCREYGISRKTGHKLKRRFDEQGIAGLFDQTRAPKHIPHKTPPEVVELVVAARRKHPSWGARKIKDVLERRLEHALPAASTIAGWFIKHGLVEPRKWRTRHIPAPTTLRPVLAPNDVWCVDYKGQFRLGDGSYCYPLTVTDQFSRYILGCEGMAAIRDEAARDAFEALFRSYGLPGAIRSDNGIPFVSTGLAGLTKLSVYWLRLGIIRERTRPAHPQDNGRHERMHRTLKRETSRPARTNLLQQQERFDAFIEEFNQERPHEGLAMQRPAEVYQSSTRAYPAVIPELCYPTHDDVVVVNRSGDIYIAGLGQVHLTTALFGQAVGIREADDGRWLVTFAQIDLGHAEARRRFTPLPSLPCEGN